MPAAVETRCRGAGKPSRVHPRSGEVLPLGDHRSLGSPLPPAELAPPREQGLVLSAWLVVRTEFKDRGCLLPLSSPPASSDSGCSCARKPHPRPQTSGLPAACTENPTKPPAPPRGLLPGPGSCSVQALKQGLSISKQPQSLQTSPPYLQEQPETEAETPGPLDRERASPLTHIT